MKSDFDQAADSKAQRESQRALDEASQRHIDTARQALERMQKNHRRNIQFFVRTKILLGLLLAAAALFVVFWTRN